jgi:thioesterase domain-containing protein
MAALMEGPSIDSLAAETAQLVVGDGSGVSTTSDEAEEWAPLMALREKGKGAPLVLLPSLGGDIRCYDELVMKITDRPVYAFRPRGLEGEAGPHESMDEMINAYAAALRAEIPNGPYHLAGWSTAGIYAVALARALADAGGEVGLVALFDTPLPEVFDQIEVDDDAKFLCDIVNFNSLLRGSEMRVDYDQLASLAPDARFSAVLDEARRLGAVPQAAPDEYLRRLVNVAEANVRALRSFKPQTLNGATRIHMFVPITKGGLSQVARQQVAEEGDLGWSTQVGQTLQVHEVPGNHFTMMAGKGATELATRLENLL